VPSGPGEGPEDREVEPDGGGRADRARVRVGTSPPKVARRRSRCLGCRAALPGLDWDDVPTRRASRIALYSDMPAGVDQEESWSKYSDWFVANLGPFRVAIQPYIDNLEASLPPRLVAKRSWGNSGSSVWSARSGPPRTLTEQQLDHPERFSLTPLCLSVGCWRKDRPTGSETIVWSGPGLSRALLLSRGPTASSDDLDVGTHAERCRRTWIPSPKQHGGTAADAPADKAPTGTSASAGYEHPGWQA
jgi:hypothetical protein